MQTAEPIFRTSKSFFLSFALLTLSACAPLVAVRTSPPRLNAPYGTSAEHAIAVAQKLERHDPSEAIGYYLSGVKESSASLRTNPKNNVALHDYNFALSRVFSVIRTAELDPWRHPLHVPAPDGGEYVLNKRPTGDPLWRPEDYDLIPADELEVHGKFVVRRVRREGAGAALVAVRAAHAPEIARPFLPPRIYTAVTAVAHFSGRKCEIEFSNPLANETVKLSGRTLSSEADFTAPLALGLARERPEKLGVPALLDPERFANKGGLIQIEPYDPNKAPVILVHGLQDTPAVWTPMVNSFWADSIIRRNYQVWVFAYPTGYPIPYSALLLRHQLDVLDKTYPKQRRIVLVGHSMGGILSRLMISDTKGDKVWRYFFGKSPAETNVSPAAKVLLKEALIFKPRRDVARVIFISTPHRGSMIARGPIGRLASSLIHKPTQFVRLGSEVAGALSVQERDPAVMKLSRMPNSIDTLSPNDPFIKAMNQLPPAKGIPYHSIIGDRGRGDTPNSSDGVVPYWSSHLEGAASEKIAPCGHGAEHNPEGIAEVLRILHEHIGSRGAGQPRPNLLRTELRYDSPCANRNGSSVNLNN